jgi:lipopolysaccharide assembly protein A
MQFLKTVFWVVLAIVAVVFSINNWTPVTLNLWGGLQLDTQLPLLLLIAFLIGLLPYFIMHRATRWSLNRKLTSAERSLAEYRSVPVAPPPTTGAA